MRGLATAYAVWVQCNDGANRALLTEMAEQLGREVSTDNELRIIVETVIPYNCATAAERKQADRLYSRDVQAIYYLHERNILPADVVKFGTKPGEGVHKWSREMAKLRKVNKDSAPTAKSRSFTFSVGTLDGKLETFEFIDPAPLLRVALDQVIADLTLLQQEVRAT